MSDVSAVPAPSGTSAWRGLLDLADRERVCGWAQDLDQPERRVRLRILDNGAAIGELLADEYREDLEAAGIGDGHHGFSLTVPGGLAPERRHLIEVQRADDGRPLFGSPFILEATAGAAVVRNAAPASWQGHLDVVTRERIEGWAWDQRSPQVPVPLVILDNGEVIARALANRYREDLENGGFGDGRHGFTVLVPGGLSPVTRHVVQVLGEADGSEMAGSPLTLEAATDFDAALEHTVRAAVSALVLPAQREHALAFFAEQTERLLQDCADQAAGREVRLLRRRHERRWGTADSGAGASAAVPLAPRALVIDDLMPALGRDAGSRAILSHLRALQILGYEVSFVAAEELTAQEQASALLEGLGVDCCRAPYYVSVEEVLRRQRDGFEVIYLHRISNASRYLALARRYCPKARILYSVADLHHVRVARQAKVESRPELQAYSRRLRLAECSAAAAASAVITHSMLEAEWLRRAVLGCNVHVVPWAVPLRPTSRPWNERSGIAFVGSFGHTPNLDAARFLVHDIMPRVWREDPSIECLLVGSGMPVSIQRLAAPRIVPLGDVVDMQQIYERVRLVVAPMRYGAGVKGKVLESLAAGVPCVMTPIAAEGIELPPALWAANGADAPALAGQILRLYGNATECEELSRAGQEFIGKTYREEAVVAALRSAIKGQRSAAELMSNQSPL